MQALQREGKDVDDQVMHSLNPVGAIVTHHDAFGDGTPLCGFLAENLDGVEVSETVTADWSVVTCLDCIAAR